MSLGRAVGCSGLLLAGAFLPQYIPAPYDYVFNLACIYAIAVVGLGILLGFAGQMSLAQAAFLGIGGYASALLTTHLQWNFWLALPAAVAGTALVGFAIGWPCLRLSGHYLALATIGFGVIVQMVLTNWRSVTNGPDGITGVPAPVIGVWVLGTYHQYYYLVYAALVLTAYVAIRIKTTRVGRALEAIRDNEIAAASMGIDVARYKVTAFVLASAFGGLAGVLFAHNLKFLSPDTYSFDLSVVFLVMLVIGGSSSVTGAIIGAVFLTFLPEWLRPLKSSYIMIYGALVVIMIVFMPEGVAGMVSALWRSRRGVAR